MVKYRLKLNMNYWQDTSASTYGTSPHSSTSATKPKIPGRRHPKKLSVFNPDSESDDESNNTNAKSRRPLNTNLPSQQQYVPQQGTSPYPYPYPYIPPSPSQHPSSRSSTAPPDLTPPTPALTLDTDPSIKGSEDTHNERPAVPSGSGGSGAKSVFTAIGNIGNMVGNFVRSPTHHNRPNSDGSRALVSPTDSSPGLSPVANVSRSQSPPPLPSSSSTPSPNLQQQHRASTMPTPASTPTPPAPPPPPATIDGVVIMATLDSDNYSLLDISGARDAAYIRERMFAKLRIPDDEHLAYSIYPTELGEAISLSPSPNQPLPLADESLFSYCRNHGDSKGTLKFLVKRNGNVNSNGPSRSGSLLPTLPPMPMAAPPPPPIPVGANDPMGATGLVRQGGMRLANGAGNVPIVGKRRHGSTSQPNPPSPAHSIGRDRDWDTLATAATSPSATLPQLPPPPPLPTPLPTPALPVINPLSVKPRSQQQPLQTPPALPPQPSPYDIPGSLTPNRPQPRPPSPPSARPSLPSAFSQTSAPPPLHSPPAPQPPSQTSSGLQHFWGSHVRKGSEAALERERALEATELEREAHGREWRRRQWGGSSTVGSTASTNDFGRSGVNEFGGIGRSPIPIVGATGSSNGNGSTLSAGSGAGSPGMEGWVVVDDRERADREREKEQQQQRLHAGYGIERSTSSLGRRAPDPWESNSPSSNPSTSPPRSMPQQMQAQPRAHFASNPVSFPSSTYKPPPLPQQPQSQGQPPHSALRRPPFPYQQQSQPAPSSTSPIPQFGFYNPTTSSYNLNINLPAGRSTVVPPLMGARSYENLKGRPLGTGSGGGATKVLPYGRNGGPASPNGSSNGGYFVNGVGMRNMGPRPPLRDRVDRERERERDAYGGMAEESSSRSHPSVDITGNNRSGGSSPQTPTPTGPISLPEVPRTDGGTLRPKEDGWILKYMEGQSLDGESTVLPQHSASATYIPPPPPPPAPTPSPTSHAVHSVDFAQLDGNGSGSSDSDESDSDDEGATLWQTPRPKPTSTSSAMSSNANTLVGSNGKPTLTLRIDDESESGPSTPGVSRDPQDPNGLTVPRPAKPPAPRESTWAVRPTAEDVYERLEEFFPGHDLDKPMIDAPLASGGTSPTANDLMPAPPSTPNPVTAPAAPNRFKHKKSIRIVANERKRMLDKLPEVKEAASSSVLRRRSTKLWGSRVEEVTPFQDRVKLPSAVPESPPGTGPKPIIKWVKGELIGKGTYGRVYLALNATTGEMIAVKQVEMPKTASDKDDSRQVTVVEALKSESDTLKDLDHPHIVQYLGFEQTPDFFSIFLEYVPGGSVGSCLRRWGKFDDDVIKSFTSHIVDGLAYLHSKKILHRDLKADNILVDPSGVCKISDFGISKRTDDIYNNASFTAMQGSIFWMAPEMLHNDNQGYNAKIDIWSLGCVVLEMWAGTRPWNQEDALAVIFKLGKSRLAPPVPPGVILSPIADDFRKKCFATNPADRPTAAELLQHPYLQLDPNWVFSDFTTSATTTPSS